MENHRTDVNGDKIANGKCISALRSINLHKEIVSRNSGY